MLLCPSLPLPADLGVTTNRHRAGLSPCKTAAYRQLLQSQPNPLSLSLFLSVRYPRNYTRQTHWGYLACFQKFIAKRGPFFFAKSEWYRCLSCPTTDGGGAGDIRGVRPRRLSLRFRNKTCTQTKLECAVKSTTCLDIFRLVSDGEASRNAQSVARPQFQRRLGRIFPFSVAISEHSHDLRCHICHVFFNDEASACSSIGL